MILRFFIKLSNTRNVSIEDRLTCQPYRTLALAAGI